MTNDGEIVHSPGPGVQEIFILGGRRVHRSPTYVATQVSPDPSDRTRKIIDQVRTLLSGDADEAATLLPGN